MGEAIVQFDDVHVFRAIAGALIGKRRGLPGHVHAHQLPHVLGLEGLRRVGGHALPDDADLGVR
ncbi:hypothetical protein D3C72_2569540 [compost metagenome]